MEWGCAGFFQGFAAGQLVHQLVQVPDLPHQGIFDLFHIHTANFAGNQEAVWVHGRGFAEEIPIADVRLFHLSDLFRAVSGEPAGHLIRFLPSAAFLLGLANQKGIDLGKSICVTSVRGIGDTFLLDGFIIPRKRGRNKGIP